VPAISEVTSVNTNKPEDSASERVEGCGWSAA
jgi:hypothetical protein